MTTYPCGCVNAVDPDSGLLRCVSKCDYHWDFARKDAADPQAYYRRLGADGEGYLRYEAELADAGVTLPAAARPGASCLEVGCGHSIYAPLILRLGYAYLGTDLCREAVEWTAAKYGVPTVCADWDVSTPMTQYDLIVAAHVLEHLRHSPAGVLKLYHALKPGGTLLVIVPDDEDKTNPDHLWFYTEAGLRRVLERCGFTDVKTSLRRVVPQEKFIYCTARRT